MLGLVAGQHGAVVGQLLAHGHDFLPQQGVLLLQEGRPYRYLVLLEPPGVSGPLGCLVILVPPAPILLVLRVGFEKALRARRSSFPCAFKDRGTAKRPAGVLLAQQWGPKNTRALLGWVPKGLVAKESRPLATAKV